MNMCFIELEGIANFFSKLRSKSIPSLDFTIFSLSVFFTLYMLYQYVRCQLQRLNIYHCLLYLNAVGSSTIYNRECCPICLYEFKAPARASCGHAFCMHCLLNYFQLNSYHWKCICPLCRAWIRDIECLYKFDFSTKEKAKIKKLENALRQLIAKQNSQIKFVQRFLWIRTNKWKSLIGITIISIVFVGALIHQFLH